MRDQINHRNRGHDPLLQVKSLPAGVSIVVGALRKREQINHQNRGHDPLLQLIGFFSGLVSEYQAAT